MLDWPRGLKSVKPNAHPVHKTPLQCKYNKRENPVNTAGTNPDHPISGVFRKRSIDGNRM